MWRDGMGFGGKVLMGQEVLAVRAGLALKFGPTDADTWELWIFRLASLAGHLVHANARTDKTITLRRAA